MSTEIPDHVVQAWLSRTCQCAERVTRCVLHNNAGLTASRLGQAIPQRGAVCRTGRLKRALSDVAAIDSRLAPLERRARREQHRLGRHCCGRHLLQRRDVGNPDGASVRAGNELAITRMNNQIMHRCCGQTTHEALPRLPAIDRHIHPNVGADKQQIAILRVFTNDVHEVGLTGRQIVHNGRERLTEVGGGEYVRIEVVAPVIVKGDVKRGAVKVRRLNA